MATASRAAASFLLLLLAIVFSALASRELDAAAAGATSGLSIRRSTAGFALGKAGQGRSLQGFEYVKKAPEKKVVEVVKKSAPSPPPPAKKFIKVQKKFSPAPKKKEEYVIDG
ncbi:g4935 [Coccomyxa viridis]|uniref:G4935 protein n=1 Tax=Coccomyxa viridis TaxID=1274662 RepID=A0ABP1FTT8_9CHLO